MIIPGDTTLFCQSVIWNDHKHTDMSLVFIFCTELVTNFQFYTISSSKLVLKICEESGNGLKVSVVMLKIADSAGQGHFCNLSNAVAS